MKNQRLPEWEDYSRLMEKQPEVQDKLERPPLTGKNRYVPEGLYDQPWSNVTDAYGKATLTPYYIEALTSDDIGDVIFGTNGLYSATTHQGSVYKSSQMAIPFLVDLLCSQTEDTAELACHFLARIALGEHHFITTPASFFKTRYFRSVNKYRKEIKAYYERTNSPEALRLLCFLPGMLPDYVDISYEGAKKITSEEETARLLQANALMVQGFLAAERNYPEKGYPREAALLTGNQLTVTDHVGMARELMTGSPSLLIRGAAAICLAYTGIVDSDILELLSLLGEQKYRGVPWVWDWDFFTIARHAWMYAADTETMLENGSEDCLVTAASRVFPDKYEKKCISPPLLPQELNRLQQRTLKQFLSSGQKLLGNWQTAGLNIPLTVPGVKRLLSESREELCRRYGNKPLWHILEEAVLYGNPEEAAQALAEADVWPILSEIYQPLRDNTVEERCTLSLQDYYSSDKDKLGREALLQSLLADGLKKDLHCIYPFLDQWLVMSEGLEGYDWKNKMPGQRIGISLLALARTGKLDTKYEALVRPYHQHLHFSRFPVILLKEVLAVTSEEHRQTIKKEFHI